MFPSDLVITILELVGCWFVMGLALMILLSTRRRFDKSREVDSGRDRC
jgi:hypothetical protein